MIRSRFVKGRAVVALAASLALTACAGLQPTADFSALNRERPASILVLPPVNKTTQLEASGQALAILPVTLAEKGYYVFPVNAVKSVLESEGLAVPDRAAQVPPKRWAELFGADAVLFTEIADWNARYAVLATVVTVTLNYKLVSAKTGETLWQASKTVSRNPSQDHVSANPLATLIGMAVSAAITKGLPPYLQLARQVNTQAFMDVGTGLPVGKYFLEAHKEK